MIIFQYHTIYLKSKNMLTVLRKGMKLLISQNVVYARLLYKKNGQHTYTVKSWGIEVTAQSHTGAFCLYVPFVENDIMTYFMLKIVLESI